MFIISPQFMRKIGVLICEKYKHYQHVKQKGCP